MYSFLLGNHVLNTRRSAFAHLSSFPPSPPASTYYHSALHFLEVNCFRFYSEWDVALRLIPSLLFHSEVLSLLQMQCFIIFYGWIALHSFTSSSVDKHLGAFHFLILKIVLYAAQAVRSHSIKTSIQALSHLGPLAFLWDTQMLASGEMLRISVCALCSSILKLDFFSTHLFMSCPLTLPVTEGWDWLIWRKF